MDGRFRKICTGLLAGASAVGIMVGGTSAARADNIQELEAQMRVMAAQMKAMQRQVEEAKGAAAAAQAAVKTSGGSGGDLDLKVKWKGAPELSSKDGKFKMKVRGRVQADGNFIDQDESITGRPDVDAVELRRARLGMEGVVFYDVNYKFEADFAGDEAAIKDAFVRYTGWPVELTIGNFGTPNSLEFAARTSSLFITFMERSAFFEAFAIDRAIGVSAFYGKKHFTLAAGVFGATAAEQGAFLQDTLTSAGRVTVAPINNDKQVLHFGASVRHRDAADHDRNDPTVDQLFRYRARGANLHLADRFVATPFIAEEDTFWGLEGLWIWGPFSVQGEYAENKVESIRSIGVDPTYAGGYIEASWFLTGEMRQYNEGAIGRPKVKNPVFKGRGWGAWQIAGRYDVIDLRDGAAAITSSGVVSCTACGEQKTWLIGVNWWLNDYTRLVLNVNQSEIDGGVNDGAEITGVGLRAQVDW